MATLQGKVNVPLSTNGDTKVVAPVNTLTTPQAHHHIHPIVAVNPWAHPNTMMTPFSNILGGGNGGILNIFDREMSHLNHHFGRSAMLTVDVVEKEDELEVDAHIGAPKESKFLRV